jgi:hypothetical protein
VTIIDFDDLAAGADNSPGRDFDPITEALSSDGEEYDLVDLEVGTGYADMMEERAASFGAAWRATQRGSGCVAG